jgi:protoporphyrinogen oxidase
METLNSLISDIKKTKDYVKTVLHSNDEFTQEDMEDHIRRCVKISKNEKSLVMMDMREINSITTDAVRFSINHKKLIKLTKALAIITVSPTLRIQLVLTAVLNLKKSPYPINIFSNEENALEWLKKYE